MSHFHSLSWQSASRPFPLHQTNDTTPLDRNSPATAAVMDFSRRMPLQVRASDEARAVRQLLETLSLRWACVINDGGALIGVICLKDLGSREIAARTGLALELHPRAASFAQIVYVVQHPEGID